MQRSGTGVFSLEIQVLQQIQVSTLNKQIYFKLTARFVFFESGWIHIFAQYLGNASSITEEVGRGWKGQTGINAAQKQTST